MASIRGKDLPRVTLPTAGDAIMLDGATSRSIVYTDLQAALDGGQIHFPATQIPSADPNTLDDYEEGNWTPTVTFATPGNLSVAYSIQTGRYTKIGRLVQVSFLIRTSTFTFTTASGFLQLNGLPFAAVNDANYNAYAAGAFSGITKAGYTQIAAFAVGNSSQLLFTGAGSGQTLSTVTASDTPSGGTLILGGTVSYVVN